MKNKNLSLSMLSRVMSSSLTGCVCAHCDGGARSSTINPKNVLKIGEKASAGDYEISVDKIEKSNGLFFEKPHKGNEFVTATVLIKNCGEKFARYSADMFKMQNADGKISANTFFSPSCQNEFDDNGILAGGGYDKGTVTFEKPIGKSGYLLFCGGNNSLAFECSQ